MTEENYVAAQNAAKDAGFDVKGGRAEAGTGNYRVVLELADPSKADRDQRRRREESRAWRHVRLDVTRSRGNQISWTMTPTAERVLADNATTQALNIIESRINALGITEPTLQTHGAQSSHQILLQMPGVQDPERVKEILKGESRLELVHVIGPPSPAPRNDLSDRRRSDRFAEPAALFRRIAKFCRTSKRIEPIADGTRSEPAEDRSSG